MTAALLPWQTLQPSTRIAKRLGCLVRYSLAARGTRKISQASIMATKPTSPAESLFRPPVNRSMRDLDRSFFSRKIPTTAARVADNKHLARLRTDLERSGTLLQAKRLRAVQPDPDHERRANGGRCLVLETRVKHDDASTWGDVLSDFERSKILEVIPFTLELGYEYWTAHDILSAILPEELVDEMTTGYNLAGHIAHLNLRDVYLPYKSLIATVILDKNPAIKTVINKVAPVGANSAFRTFRYELLAGDPSLEVEAKVRHLVFRFDYSKVYWNTRLSGEHDRLAELFRPGEAVCDVMAGVGPFALRAATNGVFVWANDLNPDCHRSLLEAVRRNKVQDLVRVFNDDGHEFIPKAVDDLQRRASLAAETRARSKDHDKAAPERPGRRATKKKPAQTHHLPPTFSHFVMNLPASAIGFLGAFRGVYRGREPLFEPHTATALPMIHVYCFVSQQEAAATTTALQGTTHGSASRGMDLDGAKREVCRRISEEISCTITPETAGTDIIPVRDVSASKEMYCASFRLPAQVAFGSASQRGDDPLRHGL